jgi:hypothetical protein
MAVEFEQYNAVKRFESLLAQWLGQT